MSDSLFRKQFEPQLSAFAGKAAPSSSIRRAPTAEMAPILGNLTALAAIARRSTGTAPDPMAAVSLFRGMYDADPSRLPIGRPQLTPEQMLAPALLQGRAIEQLSPEAFRALLDKVPESERQHLKPLVENTQNPKRKLELWACYHKAKVKWDAAKESAQTQDEGRLGSRTDAQEENVRLNKRRAQITRSTLAEVDDEVKFLLKQKKNGKLTAADVDALIQRKEHEHAIEMRHNVNLVNDTNLRKGGRKVFWSEAELTDLEAGLDQLPNAHLKGNKMLKEIRRSKADISDGKEDLTTGGDHGGGNIRIYDTALQAGYRHTKDNRELTDPRIARGAGSTIRPLEEVILHEVGHDIHDQNPEAYKRYQQAAGWRSGIRFKDIDKKGFDKQELQKLNSGQAATSKDGQSYRPDPANEGMYLSYNDRAIPTPHSPEPLEGPRRGASEDDTWWYARTNFSDHFAEHYMKAILKPETLARDLLEAPRLRVLHMKTKRDGKKEELAQLKRWNPPPTAAELKGVQEDLNTAEADLQAAVQDQAAQQQQFDIMRNRIFHTDQATAEAEKRLLAKGVAPAKLQEFRDRAGRASTPAQIALIEKEY